MLFNKLCCLEDQELQLVSDFEDQTVIRRNAALVRVRVKSQTHDVQV